MQRAAATLALLALVALASPAQAFMLDIPVTVSISSPQGVGTGVAMTVMGRADTIQSQPIVNADVTIFQNGVARATAVADRSGFYTVTFPAPATPGDHVYRSRAVSPGGLIQGESRDIVTMVRERSLPPEDLVAVNDGQTLSIYMSWHPPSDTRGAPLKAYEITRQTGPRFEVLGRVDASTLTYEDTLNLAWGLEYRYRVHAITFAGTSAPSVPSDVLLPAAP